MDPDVNRYVAFLEEAADTYRSAQRVRVILAVSAIIIGVSLILIAQLFPTAFAIEQFRWLLTLGGTFISSLCSFPVKEVFAQKAKLAGIQFLCREFQGLEALAKRRQDQELATLKEQFWKFVGGVVSP